MDVLKVMPKHFQYLKTSISDKQIFYFGALLKNSVLQFFPLISFVYLSYFPSTATCYNCPKAKGRGEQTSVL
jgi:hypothetical protein